MMSQEILLNKVKKERTREIAKLHKDMLRVENTRVTIQTSSTTRSRVILRV